MRPFAFRFLAASIRPLAPAAALFTIAAGCYGNPPGSGKGGSSGIGGSADTGGTGGSLGGHGGSASVGSAGVGVGGSTSGTAGSAGSAGAGGSASTGGGGKSLGQGCNGDQECLSGHCAGNVCCDRACTGICQECSVSGVCQSPADDSQCGTIACPADTDCRDYATSITTNRCKGVGACKTSADCPYLDAPNTRVCGTVRGMPELAPMMCDGMGTCKGPSVRCGGDGDCSVAQSWCCSENGFTCQTDACGGAPPQGPYLCDETADCAGGYICCLQSTVGGPSAICTLPDRCASDLGGIRFQVCNPVTTPSECLTASCQPVTSGPIGWYICR